MALEFPGLEGITIEELCKDDTVFQGEADVFLKYMIMRAAAIAIEALEGNDPTRSSWKSYLAQVKELREEDFERVRGGGANIYLSTLFVLLSVVRDGAEPESYDEIEAYVKEHAPTDETGRFLAEAFDCYDGSGDCWSIYFRTILGSIDQRANTDAVICALESINDEYDENGWSENGLRECNLEAYEAMVSSERGILEALDEAMYNDAGESIIFYENDDVSTELFLVTPLLNASEGDSVACFGPGMSQYAGNGTVVRYNENWKTVAMNQLFTRHFSSFTADETEDVCANPLDVIGNEKYDRIAWDFPLGRRTSSLVGSSAALDRCKQGLPEYGRSLSADWTYARLAMDALNDNGRAVIQMSNGSLMNGADTKIRRYFLNNGWIEGVVNLPDMGDIKRSLLVLSHGNEGVRFVDAGQRSGNTGPLPGFEYEGENHKYYMLNSGYAYMMYARCDDPSYDGGWEEYGERRSIYIPYNKIDEDCILTVGRYLQAELLIDNPVSLEEVTDGIFRGTSLSSSDIKMLATPADTSIKFLALSDIRDGRVVGNLLSLEELDTREDSHCAQTGDVLISRNAPMAVVVAEVPEGETLLINGNMYIIRFDPEYVNPYYAAAFLSSRLGQEVVQRLRVGTKIKTLPRKKLKKIQIPMLPMREQIKIATAYQAKLDEIEVLNLRIERAREEILMSFTEES